MCWFGVLSFHLIEPSLLAATFLPSQKAKLHTLRKIRTSQTPLRARFQRVASYPQIAKQSRIKPEVQTQINDTPLGCILKEAYHLKIEGYEVRLEECLKTIEEAGKYFANPSAESLMRCSCLTESDQDSSHDQSTSR